jgi:hypothetical protein
MSLDYYICEMDIETIANLKQERLNVEFKSWLDISLPENKAKIVKGVLALHNSNGGYMVIGRKPNPPCELDTRDLEILPDLAAYSSDALHQLVNKYAQERLSFEVHHIAAPELVIIEVSGGVRTPIAVKGEITSPDNPKNKYIAEHEVYIRNLDNGTISSATIKRTNWENAVKIWADNREADIARFLARFTPDDLAKAADTLLARLPTTTATVIANPALDLLDLGYARAKKATIHPDDGKVFTDSYGTFQVAVVIQGNLQGFLPDLRFYSLIVAKDISKLEFWTSQESRTPMQLPLKVIQGALELKVDDHRVGFWRVQPDGKLYEMRFYREDIQLQHPKTFDWFAQGIQVYRSIRNALEIARAMRQPDSEVALSFAFRWNKLAGRKLASWINPTYIFQLIGILQEAHDNEFTTTIELSLDASEVEIRDAMYPVMRDLCLVFQGHGLSVSDVIDMINFSNQNRL